MDSRFCWATQVFCLGINANTAQVILSEIGPDISSFSNEKQFKRFATLAPNIIASGEKAKRGKRKGMTSNRLGQAFRMAAVSQQNSQSALGAYFRRISKRKGYTVASFATAGKISQNVYRILRYGQEYVDIGAKAYEERFRERKIRALKQSAQELGFEVLPNQMYGSATA
jgi:transposase